jgi:hypothetical protein
VPQGVSRSLLLVNLPLFSGQLQIPIPLGVDLLLPPRQYILRRNVADGTVQALLHVALLGATVVLERPKELHAEAQPRNLRQRTAVHRQGLQEFTDLGHDARQNFALLPQSNGKIERWHKSLKGECIRPGTPLSLEDARRLVESANHFWGQPLTC